MKDSGEPKTTWEQAVSLAASLEMKGLVKKKGPKIKLSLSHKADWKLSSRLYILIRNYLVEYNPKPSNFLDPFCGQGVVLFLTKLSFVTSFFPVVTEIVNKK